jgi:hypothetical protein
MPFQKRFKAVARISLIKLPAQVNPEEKTRFEKPLPQFIDPDCGGRTNALNRPRGNYADNTFARHFVLRPRFPYYAGAGTVNGYKDTLRRQPVNGRSQGIPAHLVILAKDPFSR